MIHFRPLELNDRNLIASHLEKHCFNTYEYTFMTLYFWRKMCHPEICLLDEAIIIKKAIFNKPSYFMQPIGYSKENLSDIVLKLKDYKDSNPGFETLFADVETPFLNDLQTLFGNRLIVREDTNNFDYIYDSKRLIALEGQKYHRKRNQYNQFVSSYPYDVRKLDNPEVRKDCMNFAQAWYDSRNEDGEQLTYELDGIKDVLEHADYLRLLGIAVYIGEKIVGFSIGEMGNDKKAIVHAEKGDVEYQGIYAFLNKTMAEEYFADAYTINRQEDAGVPGLRKAKKAYYPVKLEKKFSVDIV